jgi:hypothetical protein
MHTSQMTAEQSKDLVLQAYPAAVSMSTVTAMT